MDVFRNKTLTRYDFKWYGIGIMKSFDSHFLCQSTRLFVNSYKSAPIRFDYMNSVGWLTGNLHGNMRKSFCLYYTGSVVEPHANWSMRVWRFTIGGRTPAWLRKRVMAKVEREYEEYLATYDKYLEEQGDPEGYDADE